MKRVSSILVLTLFLAGICIVPVSVVTPTARLQENIAITNGITDEVMESAELPNDPVFRVALYNETNSTLPDYGTGGMNTNYSAITTLLTTAGFDVDILTVQNIQDYELNTANYDVLVLADNLPRENITNHVKDFWLAGGGVLSLDSAISYLGYAGILYRENESVSDGYNDFWNYVVEQNSTVEISHPVTQSYQVGDILENPTAVNTAMVDLATFNTTSVWSQTTVLTVDDDNDLYARAVAVDAYDRGGKVVHIGTAGGGDYWAPDLENMIVDAIGWLTPKPKGKILFDLSHTNFYPVDVWDPAEYTGHPRYSPLRDSLVSRSYIFEKLRPSGSGNLTVVNLAPYDILILNAPRFNFSSDEITALGTWINDGGSLVVLSDFDTFFDDHNLNINYLLSSYDLAMNLTESFGTVTTEELTEHPVMEGVSELYFKGGNWVHYTGDAYPLATSGPNSFMAAQDIGAGHIILGGDINFLANDIEESHNSQFGVNLANWLTADDAGVLLFTDDPYEGGPYRNMVCQSMNQLQIPFHLVYTNEGINKSLNGSWYGIGDWDLVIIDNVNNDRSATFPHILNYLNGGGQMILTCWTIAYHPDPLWSYIGVNATGPLSSDDPSYIWDSSHPVFDGLISYSAPTLNVSQDFGIDGATCTVYDNATALTGATASEEVGNASIVLSNTGQVLFNGFMLNNLYGDADGSGYADGFELYMNEIMFMLDLPHIDSPADIQYEQGSTGHSITWNPQDSSPDTYEIFVDGTSEDSGSWDGSSITFDVDGFDLGKHVVECRVVGDSGEPRGDVVFVTVVDTTAPLLNSPADITFEVNTTGNTLTWVASDYNPSHYVILLNASEYDSGVWDGSSVEVDLDSLAIGVYFFTLRVNDTLGHVSEDVVLVTVTEPSGIGLPDWLDTQTLLIIVIGVLALIIIVMACRRRK